MKTLSLLLALALASPAGAATVNIFNFGCPTLTSLLKLRLMARQNDLVAIRRHVVEDKCVPLKPGTHVYVDGFRDEYALIRLPGQIDHYFVVRYYLSEDNSEGERR